MFDLGFPELIVCFVIALVVLGPKRMPELARKVGKWVGKARTMARQFREQLEAEVNLEELTKMTEKKAKEAREAGTGTPPIPPEFTGATPAEPIVDTPDTTVAQGDAPPAADEAPPSMASSGYPYGVSSETVSGNDLQIDLDLPPPQPHDDTYSHAHAHGNEPMPWTPELPDPVTEPAAPATEPKNSSAA